MRYLSKIGAVQGDSNYDRRLDLKAVTEKPGCNPACVVDIETNETEINWRCTRAF